MPPHVFFSFHYRRDIWRANQVRNSWITKTGDYADGRFVDASLWEETKLRGDTAVQRLIDEGLQGSDATVVLIGSETAKRKWVRYEIEESWARNNAIIGVRIHRLKNRDQSKDRKGGNPFDYVATEDGTPLSELVPVYDWIEDDGYGNLVEWIDSAPRASDFSGSGLGKALLWAAALGAGALAARKLRRGGSGPRGW